MSDKQEEFMSAADVLVKRALPVLDIHAERAAFAELATYPVGTEGWHAVRERIARANFLLVMAAVKRSRAGNVDEEDLCAEGLLILLKCVEKFDPSYGFKFGTYAMRAMNNAFNRLGVKETKHTHSPVESIDWHPTIQEEEPDAQAVREILENNIAELSDLEARFVRERFGFGGRATRTYASLGNLQDFGKERARQVVRSALDKIAACL